MEGYPDIDIFASSAQQELDGMVLTYRENEGRTRHRIVCSSAGPCRKTFPSAYSYCFRKLLGALGGETDQLSDRGRALDVYGMHREVSRRVRRTGREGRGRCRDCFGRTR